MCRMDIDALQYKHPGVDRPVNLRVGGVFSPGSKIIKRIDFSEESNVCRIFTEDGSIMILAKAEFLVLQAKSTQTIGEKNHPLT